MKKFYLTIGLVLATICFSFGQISLFGVNISKCADYNEDLIYRKINCSNNPYYTFAEYKSYPAKKMKFILYDDFATKHETPQMRNPQMHLEELSFEISKILGKDFKVYKDENLTDPVNDQYYWVLNKGNRFIVAKLFYSAFSQRNNLRVFIFDDENELVQGFTNLTKSENRLHQEAVYFSDEGLARVAKTNSGINTGTGKF